MKTRIIKRMLTTLVATMLVGFGYGQGLYLGVNGGYNLPMSTGQSIYDLQLCNETFGTTSETYEAINFSLGEGVHFGGVIGVMVSPNFGMEVDVSYLMSNKVTAEHRWGSTLHTTTVDGRMLRITPSLLVATGGETLDPYARFGVLMGTGAVLWSGEEDKDLYTYKFNKGWSFGMSAGFGLNVYVSDNFAIYGEINSNNFSYSPKEGVVTEYEEDGIDVLDDLEVYEKEFVFVDEVTYSDAGYNSNEPTELLKQKIPFGSVGLKAGVKITF